MTGRTLWLAALTLSACGDASNTLSGSVDALGYSLDFDSVQVIRYSTELVVRYIDKATIGGTQYVTNEPVRIVVDLTQVSPKPDTDIAIGSEAVLEHAVISATPDGTFADEPEFPEVRSGVLRFSELGTQAGEPVAGAFECNFVGGHTLRGDFATELTVDR